MSAVVQLPQRPRPGALSSAPRLALLGTGMVGSAFVARCTALRARGIALPAFAWLSNSRALQACDDAPQDALERARAAPLQSSARVPPWAEAESLHRGDTVVDATASETVADRHPEWLARGIHVVTANKLGAGADSGRAQAIVRAQRESGARYGDAATVGAGLPLLRSVRGLVAGGDRIHAIEGVLSGSLAWLFNRYDGTRPFSGLVREARAAGYAEPDPRLDLSGDDVRRKLLILARAAGFSLEAHAVGGESLLPGALAAAGSDEVDALLSTLDAPLGSRYEAALRDGTKLRFVGRIDAGADGACRARVGLRALAADHPLCGGLGTDNRVAVWSDRYRDQPLLIQGPGAGAEVTAAALLDDVLRIAARDPD